MTDDTSSQSPRHRLGSRLLALVGLGVMLLGSPKAAVKPSRQPWTQGDLMYMIHTRRHPSALEELAHAVQSVPGLLEMQSERDRGSERGTFQTPESQKGVVPGALKRRRGRRRRGRRYLMAR